MADSEIEKELKYLVASIPADLDKYDKKRLVDIYIPRKEGHAAIRIRQQGDKFSITKKTPVLVDGVQVLKEETIDITEEDFQIFKTMKNARILDKTRFYYPFGEHMMEIDVFSGELRGLVLAEIEFGSIDDLKSFKKPDFLLSDVTSQDFLAGGVLYKLSYGSIEEKLTEFGYSPLRFPSIG